MRTVSLTVLACSCAAAVGCLSRAPDLTTRTGKSGDAATNRTASARATDPAAGRGPAAKEVVNAVGMKFVLVPAGKFTRGSPATEAGRHADETAREAEVAKPFYLGAHEVTQEQYEKVTGANPSHFAPKGDKADKVAGADTKRFPAEGVSWDAAVAFCARLTELPEEKAAGRKYRLPTEAEWEYACRAGAATAYHSGDDPKPLGDHAWFSGNSEGRPHEVGSKKPNAWGLYDLHGNVREWCADWYDESARSGRVLRGGGWVFKAADCRSAARGRRDPGYRDDTIGFRVVLVEGGK